MTAKIEVLEEIFVGSDKGFSVWNGMGWDGMGWDGMGWDGMGWVVKTGKHKKLFFLGNS